MLALTFNDKADYEKVQEDDTIDIMGLTGFAPGTPLTMVLHHKDGTRDEVVVNHTYNAQQIEWFKAGGALNVIRREAAKGATDAQIAEAVGEGHSLTGPDARGREKEEIGLGDKSASLTPSV
jgi:hypothetical protein